MVVKPLNNIIILKASKEKEKKWRGFLVGNLDCTHIACIQRMTHMKATENMD